MVPQSEKIERQGQIERTVVGDVLVLGLAHPPNNGLTPAMRAELMQALADPGAVTKIILHGQGGVFSAGLALDLPEGGPSLRALCEAVEACPVPVIAALTGNSLGPGAELALAAHARVAEETARLCFMDVALGLVPEAGASIRLSRLVGAKEALRLLVTGQRLGATEALAIGLVDAVVEADALAGALALQIHPAEHRPPRDRAAGLRDALAYQQAVAQARGDKALMAQPVCRGMVECVDAALVLPFAQACALEEVVYHDLRDTAEAAALKSAFLAERRAASLPAPIAAARPRAVAQIGLVGAAPGLVSIAVLALARGFRVTWFAEDREALKAMLHSVARLQEAEVAAGRLGAAARDADWARLSAVADPAALREAGFVLLAQDQGGAAGRVAALAPQAVLAVLGGAEGQIGLALAPAGPCCEVAFPEGVSTEAAASAVGLIRRLGLFALMTGKAPVIGARVTGAGQAALRHLVQAGVSRADLLAALAGFGLGLSALPAGADAASGGAMPAAPISARQITARWLGAMANEGFRLLAAGVARRPSDIDHCLVTGHGFPRSLAGPMHQAQRRGLIVLRADLRKWQGDDPVWQPAPLIDRLISDGKMMAALDAR